jgi:hypothetical protein
MSKTEQSRLIEVLEKLAKGDREPLATLAEGFIPAAAASETRLDGRAYKEIRERISVLIEQLVAAGSSPSKLIEDLIEIDSVLMANGVNVVPFATRLSPLALDCALHAEKETWLDKLDGDLSAHSPIFKVNGHTLYAVPVGLLRPQRVLKFIDRILAQVLRQQPKRVVLMLSGLDTKIQHHAMWKTLDDELNAQKIDLEKITGDGS